MSELKERIRVAARARRSALSHSERRVASTMITHTVLGLWELDGASTVLAYVATGDEVDPHEIVEALRVRGTRIVLPRVQEPVGLALHAVADDGQLVSGAFGVTEPDAHTPLVDPAQIDAAIVPGVAFDPLCNRIGFGGGFYDRLLPHLRGDCPRVGLAFDEQMIETVPTEPHDAQLDMVVTSSTIWRRVEPA